MWSGQFTDFKSVNSCGLTNSKGTCGNKMLQYVSINDKYKLNVIKYTTTVNAGNFQSGIIVVSNNKDKAVVKGYCLILCTERSDKVADGTKV